MKRIIVGILFLFCMVGPYMVAYILLNNEITAVRRRVKENLEHAIKKEDLTLLHFSVNETKHLLDFNNEHEFEFQNQMYDIVYSEMKNDSVYYWCLPDYEETALKAQVKNLLPFALQNNATHKHSKNTLTKLYKTQYFHPIAVFNFNGIAKQEKGLTRYFFSDQSIHFSPPAPPPKFG